MIPAVALFVSGAGIGALISSVATFIGQRLEREARIKEFMLKTALDMANVQVQFFQDLATHSGKPVDIYPRVVYARWYMDQLVELHSSGRLTPGMENKFADFFDRNTGTEQAGTIPPGRTEH